MDAEIIGISGIGGAGFVLAIVYLLRRFVGITDRFTPMLAVLVGVVLNVAVKMDAVPTEETTWLGTVLLGIMTGLTASGVYSGGKAIAGR